MNEKLKHLAIIMDGNRRWAKAKNKTKKEGHRAGAEKFSDAIKWCIEFDVKYLTVYAFSTENWKRDGGEINDIMALLGEYLELKKEKFNNMGVNLKIIGIEDNIDKNLLSKIRNIEKTTTKNETLFVNIAFNYGGRREILDTTKNIAKKIKENILQIEEIDENIFKNNMYNPSVPDPDLVIRTGGEYRISNFLLWEIAYSEFFFSDTLWPDFSRELMEEVINNFNNRERRYGGTRK